MQKPVEADFGAVLDAAPDAMLMVDQQGRIVLANIQCEQIFGHSRDELIGQKIEVLVPPRFRSNTLVTVPATSPAIPACARWASVWNCSVCARMALSFP